MSIATNLLKAGFGLRVYDRTAVKNRPRLSSITWREAWKYGERAFRYCQHDLGHAVAALRISAAICGWQFRLVPNWSTDDVAALLGLDRKQDLTAEEHEEPEVLAVVIPTTIEGRKLSSAKGLCLVLKATKSLSGGRWSM